MALLNSDFLAAGKGGYEPQRPYRWSLEIALNDPGDQFLIVTGHQSFGGVDWSNEEIELRMAGEPRFVAGQARWESAPLVLYDYVDRGVLEALIRWRYEVYNPETGSTGLAANYKKNADLQMVAPDQSSARFFKFIGMWPQRLKFGELSQDRNDAVMIECILRFDKGIPGSGLNTGLGSINVGSTTIGL